MKCDWQSVLVQELDRRLGRELLLLLADAREEPALNQDVSRWVLVVRDAALPLAREIVQQLMLFDEGLARAVFIQVLSYSEAMSHTEAGLPEWLQVLDSARRCAGDEQILALLQTMAKEDDGATVEMLLPVLKTRARHYENQVRAMSRQLVESYYQYVMSELQQAYLTRYPQTLKQNLRILGSPAPLLRELSEQDDADLRARAELAQEMLKAQSRADLASGALISLFRDMPVEADGKETEDAGN